MDYSTKEKVRSYLWLWPDENIDSFFANAQALMDTSLGENFWERTKVRRVDWAGTCRIVMENVVTAVTEIKEVRTGHVIELDFFDGRVIWAKEIMDCGMKNIQITYKLGYTEVPKDLEEYFLEYCKVLYQRSLIKNPFWVVESKKIDDLSINFLSPAELMAQSEKFLSRPEMKAVIKKYRNFSF